MQVWPKGKYNNLLYTWKPQGKYVTVILRLKTIREKIHRWIYKSTWRMESISRAYIAIWFRDKASLGEEICKKKKTLERPHTHTHTRSPPFQLRNFTSLTNTDVQTIRIIYVTQFRKHPVFCIDMNLMHICLLERIFSFLLFTVKFLSFSYQTIKNSSTCFIVSQFNCLQHATRLHEEQTESDKWHKLETANKQQAVKTRVIKHFFPFPFIYKQPGIGFHYISQHKILGRKLP